MRVAFVNTRMPGNTFIARDLRALLCEGLVYDLYLFDAKGLFPDLRREIEASGGSIRVIPFPGTGATWLAVLKEAVRRPDLLAGSIWIGLVTSLISPPEGIRCLAVLPTSIHLARTLRQDGIGQVHGLWAGVPATVAFWVWRHARIPYSFSGHAWDVARRTRLLRRKIRTSRGVVVCSEFARRTVSRRTGGDLAAQVHVVHHGLDLTRWEFAPRGGMSDPAQILAVGSLIYLKGFEYLIRACDVLRARGLRFHCRIVGKEGDSGERLRQLVAQLELSTHVTLRGERPSEELVTLMKEADVLVSPSVQKPSGRADGIPNVILEAMALGTPVVASDAGGIPEVVRHGETGRVVPQRDAEALASAIEAALTDRDSTRSMSEAARSLVLESFEARGTAKAFLDATSIAPGD